MRKITVAGSKKYDIIIDKNILSEAYQYIKPFLTGNIVYIVTDDIVDSLYGSILTDSLESNGLSVFKYIIPHGEHSKNTDNYIAVLNDMATKGVSRSDMLIAFGGGIPGDLGGFAAATYLRGIPLLHIPTTLLATVDSSIGGKTGIDLKEGKNLAGAFYQPQAVICDLSLLDTLPDEVFKDGYAEIIKYGILSGNQLFNRIKIPLKSDIESIVYECVKIKRDIVQKDESDIGMRQLLNLGHTIAHAVELLSGYTISHGAAVAKGLHLISKISYTQGLCTKEVLTKITDMLNLHGFNTDLLYGAKDIANAITADKKRSSGHINLILIRDIGKCTIEKTDMSDLTDIIQTATEYRG